MIKTKKLLIPLYEQTLVIATSSKCEDLSEFTKKNDWENTEMNYSGNSGASFTDGSGKYFITLRTDIKLTPGVIAHECKHTINALYQDLSIKLCTVNDEPECYLLTWMVDTVWEFYNKQLELQNKQ